MGASRGGHDLGYWTMMLQSQWLGVVEGACCGMQFSTMILTEGSMYIAPITHTNECIICNIYI